MERKYNYMSFTPEEAEACAELLATLLHINALDKDHYNDVHITTDGYCTIVEWAWVPHNHAYGGQFKYVDEDQETCLARALPDGTLFHFDNEWEYEEALVQFLRDNPNYVRDGGRWVKKNLDKQSN